MLVREKRGAELLTMSVAMYPGLRRETEGKQSQLRLPQVTLWRIYSRNAVHLDTMLAPLVTEGLCELSDCAFGCGVRRNSQTSLKREQRSKVDDLSWGFSREIVRACCLRKQPDGFEVDVDDLAESRGSVVAE